MSIVIEKFAKKAEWARTFFPHAQHASHTLHVRLRFVTYFSNHVKSPNLLLTLLWVAKESTNNFQSRGRCSWSDEFVQYVLQLEPFQTNGAKIGCIKNDREIVLTIEKRSDLLPRNTVLKVFFFFNNQVQCPQLIQTFLDFSNSLVWSMSLTEFVFSVFSCLSQFHSIWITSSTLW